MTILESLITSGIDCSLKTLDVRPRGHRHHGLWFDLRSAMSAALTVLAIIKSGNAAWIPGGVEAVWGPEEYGGGSLGAGGRRKFINYISNDFFHLLSLQLTFRCGRWFSLLNASWFFRKVCEPIMASTSFLHSYRSENRLDILAYRWYIRSRG